jgi:hypothetical protein
MSNFKPRYKHNCKNCKFIGRDGEADIYRCGEDIIRRIGNDEADYEANPMSNVEHKKALLSWEHEK